jgi:apolipoprotein N-acyltransferase
LVTVSAIWVALEWVRGWFLTGFPWNFLGTSQWRQVALIQVASVTGVYGISFLVCWVSTAMAASCISVASDPANRRAWMAEVRLPMIVVLLCLGWGFHRAVNLRRDERGASATMLRLALVQPSIPQTLLWDPRESERSFGVASRLTMSALETKPDVVVWPEGDFGLTRENFASMTARLAAAGVGWVFTATDVEETASGNRHYNAAFVTGPDGRVRATYRKRRLVAFGEYVPFAETLPFLRHLTPIGDGFAAGNSAVAFPMGLATASPVICFEDIFPHGVRGHVSERTDFLLELTNDGWFGRSGAQWQHLANAVFRTVENGVALVRCTNNGITAWVDELGVVRDVLGESGDAVYREGFLTVRIPVRLGRAGDTWYGKHGDVFAYVCVATAVWGNLRRGRRTEIPT